MTAQEAHDILIRSGIDPYLYNIGAPKLAECLVLRRDDDTWVTYTWERGQENFKKRYESEDAAARAFLREVQETAAIAVGHPITLK